MPRWFALVIVWVNCLLSPVLARGQSTPEQSARDQTVNLALFWPTATNPDPNTTASVRLSLLYGRLGGVEAFDLNGVVGRTHGDVSGLQLSGIYARTDGSLNGVSLAGGINYVNVATKGVLLGGLAAYARDRMTGFQGSLLLNLSNGGFSGLQWGGVFNLNEGSGGGLQLAGLTNVSAGSFRGLQIAALSNIVGSGHGVQAGAFNLARESSGAQLGIFNYTGGEVRGFSVGAFNWAEGTHHGVPVGLVNLADNGGIDVVAFGSNLSLLNAGVRTSVNRFYSMLTLGTIDVLDEIDGTLFITWNFGYEILRTGRFTLGADVGYVHVGPGRTDDPSVNGRPHPGIQVRGLAEYRFSPRVSAFGGGGASWLGTSYLDDDTSNTFTGEPLVFAGVGLY